MVMSTEKPSHKPDARSQVRASLASEPRERSAPAQRRARARVGESEGRSPSDQTRDVGDRPPVTNPGTAAVLSAVIPGLGQFYNGDFLRGIFWLIVTPGMWIGTGGLLGWVCHVIAAMTAYRRARLKARAI